MHASYILTVYQKVPSSLVIGKLSESVHNNPDEQDLFALHFNYSTYFDFKASQNYDMAVARSLRFGVIIDPLK